MTIQEIQTPLGIINGRDAIILKNMEPRIYPNELLCFVEINSNSCSDYHGVDEFVNCKIIFERVVFFSMYSIDYFPYDKFVKSSFDKVLDSGLLKKCNEVNDFIHVILSCYDHIIEVGCKSYTFNIIDLDDFR